MSKTLAIALALSLTASMPLAVHAKPAKAKAQAASTTSTAEQLAQRGWLGVELGRSATSSAVTVLKVAAGSPAENAGLKPGDVIYGANGVRYDEATADQIARLNESMKPGALVTYLVRTNGEDREVKATLGKIPEDVLTRMLGSSPAPKG